MKPDRLVLVYGIQLRRHIVFCYGQLDVIQNSAIPPQRKLGRGRRFRGGSDGVTKYFGDVRLNAGNGMVWTKARKRKKEGSSMTYRMKLNSSTTLGMLRNCSFSPEVFLS
jgi:hypothetical protein